MAVNAFLTFFDQADGESTQRGHERWVEVQAWDWEVEAESSWAKGGGASVSKPVPGSLSFVHSFDTSSTVAFGFICSGTGFAKIELDVTRASGKGNPQTYFIMTLEEAFLTKVSISGSEDGLITQRVELVFKTVQIDYHPQDQKTGALGVSQNFQWDIPAGNASPSA